jgi:hypothetical protein
VASLLKKMTEHPKKNAFRPSSSEIKIASGQTRLDNPVNDAKDMAERLSSVSDTLLVLNATQREMKSGR